MKLALSVRVAEGFGDKRRSTASLDDLARIATENGYAALCMRASQLGTHTPLEEVQRARQTLDAAGLAVSMVTGDFPIRKTTMSADRKRCATSHRTSIWPRNWAPAC